MPPAPGSHPRANHPECGPPCSPPIFGEPLPTSLPLGNGGIHAVFKFDVIWCSRQGRDRQPRVKILACAGRLSILEIAMKTLIVSLLALAVLGSTAASAATRHHHH